MSLASAEPHDKPHLSYRYLEDPRDLQRLREAMRICQRLLAHPALEPLIEGWLAPTEENLVSDEALDTWLIQNVNTTYHPSGTCKMGPGSDPMAVVDQYGRVKGLQGLRIADLSIAPDVVRANTNATAIMIAERVANWI